MAAQGEVIAVGHVREEQILAVAKTLFARKGFDSVSMRDLAKAVGISPPALYHYFPTKQSLQVATLVFAHESTPATALDRLKAENSLPEERLYNFILRLCERFQEDPDFLALLERAILCHDEEIRNAFVNVILQKNFIQAETLLAGIAPDFDHHLLATFIFGLVIHTFKTNSIRKSIPGYRQEHNEPRYVADNIFKLLRNDIIPPKPQG